MPTVVNIPQTRNARRQHGIKIGCCRVCTCKKAWESFLCLFVIAVRFFLGLHLEFLTTKCGLLKIFELLLGKLMTVAWKQFRHIDLFSGSCCETLLIRFGMAAASEMGKLNFATWQNHRKNLQQFISGEAFYSFHSTVAACLTTTMILLISYIFSARTYGLMRQSIFVRFIVFKSLQSINRWTFRKFSSTHLPAFCILALGQ